VEPSDRSPGLTSGSTDTVTVAELLARCTGASPPPPRLAGPDGAVSVAALLRREGRGPHVADRPLVPRGHARIAQPPPEPPRRTVRKVAVAAGALFAATAVLGPSVVEDAANRSASGLGAGIPLPPASLPLSADHGWSGNAAGTGATADDGVVLAAVRQIFAEGVPSEVGSPAFDRLGTEPAAGSQYFAVRRPQTPDRASAGPTGPTAAPASGTVPPGGAGTPPGGTWSYATEPDSSKPGAGPPAHVPAHARSNAAGNGPPADTPGNGPPHDTPAAARSNGGGNGPPADTPGNGPPHKTGNGRSGGDGKKADRADQAVVAASEGSAGSGRKNAEGAAAENASDAKNARSRAATGDKAADDAKKDRPDRDRSGDSGSSGKDRGGEKKNDSSDRDNGRGSDDKGSDKGSDSKSSSDKGSSKDSGDKGNSKGSGGKGGSDKGDKGGKGNGGGGG
jgi:hypothetical protein